TYTYNQHILCHIINYSLIYYKYRLRSDIICNSCENEKSVTPECSAHKTISRGCLRPCPARRPRLRPEWSSWQCHGLRQQSDSCEAGCSRRFAAWEQPELFSEEIRAAFRSLR